jgi:L-ascorbate metabolism protein UlaG (beta-lactamase superfamily)
MVKKCSSSSLLLVSAAMICQTVCPFATSTLRMSSTSSASASSTPLTADRLFDSHWRKKDLPTNSLLLTYLEINGWILTINGVTVLVDPILDGSLDFGIPFLYKANKRVMSSQGLIPRLPPIDGILITQGLDDHAHSRTLQLMSKQLTLKTSPVVAPPSAVGTLLKCGFLAANVKSINHGEEVYICAKDNGNNRLRIRATQGALVGPPWQARENGYILGGGTSRKGKSGDVSTIPSLYMEPHVEFSSEELKPLAPVDVVITPVVGQSVKPGYELVHGPNDALRLIDTLRPKFVLPMNNGDVDQEGPASALVLEVGSVAEFGERLAKEDWAKGIELVQVKPGQDIEITV